MAKRLSAKTILTVGQVLCLVLVCIAVYSVVSQKMKRLLMVKKYQKMKALILAKNSSGRVIGRCDASCYDAKHSHCDCVCCGKNHGIGYKKALERTKEMFDKKELKDNKLIKFEVGEDVVQDNFNF